MARITDIRQQRRRRGRVSLFVDNDFWCGMSLECLADLGFRLGQELTAEELTQAAEKIASSEALGYCFDALSRRSLSRYQLEQKLQEREYSAEVIEATLARCQELHLLDDRQVAFDLALARRERGEGERKAADALRRAGIDKELAAEALEHIFLTEEEDDRAQAALSKRYRGPFDQAGRRRAYQFLLRRGFSPQAAQRAINLFED